ncbi:MAG: YraN family protein [Rhizobiales bacterium]|nr:YraN family protein [Hyphomicrobiales bacterium]
MARGNPDRGRIAHRLGHVAEAMACFWLMAKGYRIRARRFKTHAGEIDIVVSRGRLLAFVEVKARPDFDRAMEALSPKQRQRLLRAAELYVARHPKLASYDLRFDMVLIAPRRLPRHVVNAWQA